LSAFGREPAFLVEEGLLSRSFVNEGVDMRVFSLKIVALLTAVANVAAFGGLFKAW
jgi:hypothetical protein